MDVKAIYFSPTRSTGRYIQAIVQGMGVDAERIDITLPEGRQKLVTLADEIVLLGFPVYGSRIPKLALDYFKTLQGNGNLLVCAAVYGNMETGITFRQVRRIAHNQNFRFVAAGAFVAQHTYADARIPVGLGRPDAADVAFAVGFGAKVMVKLHRNDFQPPHLEHSPLPLAIESAPYNMMQRIIRPPRVDFERCNRCRKCQKHCPAGAITDSLEIVENRCLRCLACVKVCPVHAREGGFKVKWMEETFAYLGRKPKNNQMYI